MTDEPRNTPADNAPADNPISGNPSPESAGDKATKKKTSRRPTKKPAPKKAAAKKTTKKKTVKKAAAKKKAAKKPSSTKAPADAPGTSDADLADDISWDVPADASAAGADRERDADTDTEMDAVAEADADLVIDAEGEGESESEDESEGEGDEASQSRGRSRSRRGSRSSKKAGGRSSRSAPESSKPAPESRATNTEMIINYVPGEECRIAMLEDGQLEEFMVEPTDKVSRVGNVYVGRIANIEPAIQAAFIDFGTEENGFLHISDLHPQYFAKGDEKTERVGKKTPRRSRPPIQECLKRGQEIIVQVLKEGVGTKGPTLTSYLSIPGRFLVMMPGMDKVGVSRKEEDDDKRKAAKQILSQLELPEGFGFILRTAGFDRTKAELKRDLAYLARLWKDMESRRKKGKRPRLLYTESDLLVRSIRDLLTSEVSRVVIDSEPALKRVARFIKIAAPRSATRLSHYTGSRPIFHAFGIESQINAIHAREVTLPSGGRLVIDQTEALVAIDVNSGKSRAARDAETNAFQTNLEAVDSICRQLRLRDMGGLVVCDMIDMRHASHRKQIEQRFSERLKRDRAKSTTAPISPFGLLEMTRQRMRGSMESQHFAECPVCHGRGLIKRPDSVAATAIRDLAALLDHEKVSRAELVVNPRVASSLLSTKRASLTRIELISGKTLDVRVSESLPIDRVAFYAYDANGADIAIEKLKSPHGPNPEPHIVEWRDESSPDGSWAMDPLDEVDETTVQKLAEEIARKAEQAEHVRLPVEGELDEEDKIEQPKKKRRRRRGGKGRSAETAANGDDDTRKQGTEREDDSRDETESESPSESRYESRDDSGDEGGAHGDDDQPRKKRRRRRRRGGRARSGEDSGNEARDEHDSDPDHEPRTDEARQEPRARDHDDDAREPGDRSNRGEQPEQGEGGRRRPRRRPVPAGRSGSQAEGVSRNGTLATAADTAAITEPKPKRGQEPPSQPKAGPKAGAKPQPQPGSQPQPESQSSAKPRRGLYAKSRRTLSASELARLGIE